MRTLVDLPEEDITLLSKLAKDASVSRAELVRQAVAKFLEPHRKTSVREFFGMWPDFPEDGQAFQDRLRSEWER